ncbi:MAG: hypothetical protein V1740_01005 [Candidatus Woesearchaeota archaeon]
MEDHKQEVKQSIIQSIDLLLQELHQPGPCWGIMECGRMLHERERLLRMALENEGYDILANFQNPDLCDDIIECYNIMARRSNRLDRWPETQADEEFYDKIRSDYKIGEFDTAMARSCGMVTHGLRATYDWAD